MHEAAVARESLSPSPEEDNRNFMGKWHSPDSTIQNSNEHEHMCSWLLNKIKKKKKRLENEGVFIQPNP